jgi:hypothetical protein
MSHTELKPGVEPAADSLYQAHGGLIEMFTREWDPEERAAE